MSDGRTTPREKTNTDTHIPGEAGDGQAPHEQEEGVTQNEAGHQNTDPTDRPAFSDNTQVKAREAVEDKEKPDNDKLTGIT